MKLRAGLDRPYFLLRRQNNVERDSQLTKGADVGAVDSKSFGTEFPCRKRVSYNTARGWWERGRTVDRLLILHRTYFRLDLCIDDRETLSRGHRDSNGVVVSVTEERMTWQELGDTVVVEKELDRCFRGVTVQMLA